MAAIKKLASRSAGQMELEDPLWLDCAFDDCDDEESVWSALDGHLGNPIIVVGNWRNNMKIDVYDIVLRFAESHYSKIRQEKFLDGPFAVLMGRPLED